MAVSYTKLSLDGIDSVALITILLPNAMFQLIDCVTCTVSMQNPRRSFQVSYVSYQIAFNKVILYATARTLASTHWFTTVVRIG